MKLKLDLPNDPTIPLLGMYPKELRSGSHRDLCTPCSTQPYSQQSRYGNSLSVHQLMNRGRRPGMEYYSAMRYKEIPPFAVIWMDLTLNEISQTEKNKYLMISCICRIQKRIAQKQRVEWLLAEALGQGNWGDTAQRVQIIVRR